LPGRRVPGAVDESGVVVGFDRVESALEIADLSRCFRCFAVTLEWQEVAQVRSSEPRTNEAEDVGVDLGVGAVRVPVGAPIAPVAV